MLRDCLLELRDSIFLFADGFNAGRSHIFRADSLENRDKWLAAVELAAKLAKKSFKEYAEEKQATTVAKRVSLKAYRLYRNAKWRFVTGTIVCASFGMDIFEAEVAYNEFDKEATREALEWVIWLTDVLFTLFFFSELAVNYLAHFCDLVFMKWASKPWNVLDIFVNVLSVVSFLVNEDALRMLRPIRVFRVIRLFRRFRSLNRIVAALGSSLQPVSSAMALLIITTMAFAVLATTLFREDNPEFFRDFSTSMFTM